MNTETLELLFNRTSVRDFLNKVVPDEVLSKILEMGTRAPSGGNLQSYGIIVTQDPDRRKALGEIHFGQPMFLTAPVILTFCVDVERNSRWCKLRGANAGFDNLWGFLLGMADAWSAAQNVVVAAESLELGSCHSGATFVRTLSLIDFFGCPRGVLPVATLVLGYPSKRTARRGRLPQQSVVHEETYHQASDDVLLAAYQAQEDEGFRYYEGLYERVGKSQGKIDQLAKIYTEIKYRGEETSLFSENFTAALKKQGFI
ncbi:nitroreductase family protein [Bdellovibrionota bacterium FG-2]